MVSRGYVISGANYFYLLSPFPIDLLPILGDLAGTPLVDYFELPLGPSLYFDSSTLKFFFRSAPEFSFCKEPNYFFFNPASFLLSVRPMGDRGEV